MDRRYGGSWAQRLKSLFDREGLAFDSEGAKIWLRPDIG